MRFSAASVLVAISSFALWARGEVDFVRDVKPIFVSSCYSCHGPQKQKGELRLDARVMAMKGGESGRAILPGKAAESLLLKLVRGEDADRVMPAKGERLTDTQIEVLRKWIDDGASWPDDGVKVADKAELWSLKPVARREPPAVKNSAWVKHEIDRFILARLEKEGLSPRAEADRRTLIRRVTFDLIGLPPSPAEIDAFLQDESADAYEKVVDRLLASPRFGERWARHWLDVVRYADSHGFEMNNPRPAAWPYRDWVIAAMNADMPYDEFVREQISGEGSGFRVQGSGGKTGTGTVSSSSLNREPLILNPTIATGFLVSGPWDQVKSPDPGLTAQQRADELHDMVSVTGSAFLGLTVGCARCHDHKFDPISQMDYYRMTAIFAGVNHGERALPVSAEVGKELTEVRGAQKEIEEKLARFVVPVEKSKLRPAVVPLVNEDRFDATEARFVRFNILATKSGDEPCIDELEVFTAGDSPRNVVLASAGGKASASGTLAGFAIHQVAHLNDGLFGNSHSWISNERGKGWVQIELAKVEKIDRVVWGRDREGRYKDRTPVRYSIEVALDARGPWRKLASDADRLPVDGKQAAKLRYAAKAGEEQRELDRLLAEKKSLEEKAARLSAAPMVYAGQFSQPRPTYRLHRGEALSPREAVTPGAIAVLSPALDLPANSPEKERRIALARWTTDASNPLTARVIVNRLWQHHFGRGIVATPSDFGHMGGTPSHPELLDYLTSELVRGEWKMKAIHRMIVLSAAYRQGSTSDAQAREIDGDDSLLWRFSPRRLEAEALRDSVLAVSGKLDLTAGGPGFDLFKPNSNYVRVYEAKEEFGPAEFRRMIYAQKPRLQGDGVFAAFDCPDAGQTQPRRAVSTTPLQALNLLNSRFMLDQSKFFAEKLEREAGADMTGRVRLAFELAFGREPSGLEREAAAELIREHGLAAFCRAIYNANEFVYVQ